MAMMENSPSREMGNKSVGTLSALRPVAATGELSNQRTRVREESFTRVNGLVTGCLVQILVEVVLAILMVHDSVSPTFAFRVLWCRALNHKSAQDLHLLPLLPLLLHRLLPVAHVRPKWARTMMEQTCSPVPSTQAALTNAAAIARPLTVALGTRGSMPTTSAG
jgi:hypothetical protein